MCIARSGGSTLDPAMVAEMLRLPSVKPLPCGSWARCGRLDADTLCPRLGRQAYWRWRWNAGHVAVGSPGLNVMCLKPAASAWRRRSLTKHLAWLSDAQALRQQGSGCLCCGQFRRSPNNMNGSQAALVALVQLRPPMSKKARLERLCRGAGGGVLAQKKSYAIGHGSVVQYPGSRHGSPGGACSVCRT